MQETPGKNSTIPEIYKEDSVPNVCISQLKIAVNPMVPSPNAI